ncbi:lysophospholipid acyltransferase family protein [Hyphococcus sp.]|uniref:lysophospholipid acyltransferase family protein n=1 Tax=Hyphococcus sp. TaxID=2038636 RepID=UPI002083B693|nr:MAG: 1-acyl-sn-glycerol-3-phosphate acyltransferase [Marinicaulis sp.]
MKSTAYSAFLVILIALMGILCLPLALLGRDAARATIKIWAKLSLRALKLITGISHRIEGAENIPSEGALIAANHQSMWETIALYALAPRPVIVFKQELTAIPVYGWWAGLAGNIQIDRGGGAKALRAMTRKAKAHTDTGEQIIIFPEGTRAKPGERRTLLPGVAGLYAATGAPCVPVAHDSGRYWRHPGNEKVPGTITLRFLPAIPPGLDRKVFLFELNNRIENARPDLASKVLEHNE